METQHNAHYGSRWKLSTTLSYGSRCGSSVMTSLEKELDIVLLEKQQVQHEGNSISHSLNSASHSLNSMHRFLRVARQGRVNSAQRFLRKRWKLSKTLFTKAFWVVREGNAFSFPTNN
ncbi:hypothetical protein [Leptospira noguchii]|uniref:Uncharacterized protein n=1 Tax=Leptospira noguchii TaxID=28182 RepID=A0AAE9GMI0_9LEPT|nr:hypothetical protein [Leptospira noguchii]UOG58810.1 hypothetical protein MAL03_20465 [Leptospira noguchii]